MFDFLVLFKKSIFPLQKFLLSTEGVEVSLEKLLEARESRALLQRTLLNKYQQTLLSLTLTAVGGVKKNALLDYIFARALDSLNSFFKQQNIEPIEQMIRPLDTGHEAFFVLPVPAIELKKQLVKLEESLLIGRLWDLDVFDENGVLLSRADIGVEPRECLVCQDNAKWCARERKHSLEHIMVEMQSRVFADRIAQNVTSALLTEARLTPKPGLVDSHNNGAHKDMNLHTFEQSAAALTSYWADFVCLGQQLANESVSQILAKIRPLGLAAEQAMLSATKGVNTHKGSIFAFGLVCVALGRLFALGQAISLKTVCELVAQVTQGITQELQNYPENIPLTAGVKLYRQYGVTGARGEAESGFPLVQAVFATLNQYSYLEFEHKFLIVLLQLMANNQDTNLLNRGGISGLQFVQHYAQTILSNPDIYLDKHHLADYLTQFDTLCIEKNLSAGGCADLLALTVFFFLI